VVIPIPPLDNAVGQNLHLPLLPTNDIKLVSDLVVLPHSHIQVFAVEHPPANGSVVAESERVHRESVLRAKARGRLMGKPERYKLYQNQILYKIGFFIYKCFVN